MTTPLAELLAKVPALNNPAEPFTYAVVGTTITGSWDIVNAQYLEWAKAGAVDKDYVIVVDFNEGKGTFDFEETKHEGESAVSVDDGTISFGTKKSVFIGKSTSKSFSFEAGGIYNKAKEGIKPYLSYEFETARIKKPLFDFLEANGWKRKKGFLSGLFNS